MRLRGAVHDEISVRIFINIMIVQLGAFWVGFVPESPNSLLNGGKMEEAREVLRRFNS